MFDWGKCRKCRDLIDVAPQNQADKLLLVVSNVNGFKAAGLPINASSSSRSAPRSPS